MKVQPLSTKSRLSLFGWRMSVTPQQQWTEWVTSGYSWRNFTLVQLAFEVSDYKGRTVEVEIGLLGLALHVELYNGSEREDFAAPMQAMIRAVQDGTAVTLTLDEARGLGIPVPDAAKETTL